MGVPAHSISLIPETGLLEQYALAVPEGIEVSGEPTLEAEILQTFARRIAAGEQLINQVEREAAEQRAQEVASLTQGIRKEELQAHLSFMKALSAEEARLRDALNEKEVQDVELKWRQQIEENEADYQRRPRKNGAGEGGSRTTPCRASPRTRPNPGAS